MKAGFWLRRGSRLLGMAAFVFGGLMAAGSLIAAPAETTGSTKELAQKLRTLATANAVHSLSSKEAARAFPVHLRAVVTFFDPKVGAHRTGLFVHDSTGSIFVELPQGVFESLPAGSLVDLRGVSGAGEFAPIVAQPEIKVIGYQGLPADADRPSLARLLSGAEDGQWVEVEGVVHSLVENDRHISLQLTMSDGTTSILITKEAGVNYSRLVDAKVRIRGNASPLFDRRRRQMIGVRIQCPNLSAVEVLEPAPGDPFKLPVMPIDRLLQWDVVPLLAHRVHVRGQVTLQWPGSSVCIRDATRGICAQTIQTTRLRSGEIVDIAGFARAEGSAPILTDAVFRDVGLAATTPITALPVTAEQALLDGHESEIIQIEGLLVSRDLASTDIRLLIRSGKTIFTAVLPQDLGGAETSTWKEGSVLRITGICSVQLDAERTGLEIGTAVPMAFSVLMRSPADVVIVRKPSWWTPPHMVLLLAVALAGTLGVLWWVVVLRRRIRLSEERFRHMAQHDTLTGLATRLVLQDRLNVALEAAKRHHTGLAVLMLDLDRFKEVNDTFGHSAGDEVLRVTANRLLESVRKSDTVARVGGDEFVILLPEFDSANVESIAAKLVVVASGPIQFENHAVPVSVSVGVCTFSAEEMDAVEMLKGADAALYEAKEHGRRRFSIYIPRFSASQSVMGVELSSQVEGRARIAASEWIRPVRNGSDGS